MKRELVAEATKVSTQTQSGKQLRPITFKVARRYHALGILLIRGDTSPNHNSASDLEALHSTI